MNVTKDAGAEPLNTITVLSVSPSESEHAALEQIFGESETTLYPNCRPAVQRSGSLESALSALRESRIPIVIFDGDWLPGAWREVIAGTRDLPAPPCLIVTSESGDDRLWAEALSHGAFDVIVKPFNKNDVIRIITAAWRRWRIRYAEPAATAGATGTPSET